MTVLFGTFWSSVKQIEAPYVFDWENAIALDTMQGKLASSQFDLGHTDLFCVPEMTSGFFLSCDSVVGDALEFNQGY